MDTKDFHASLSEPTPPKGLSNPAKGLWAIAKRDFKAAEQYLKGDDSKEASWVRAHMHRVQGNQTEADEWYGKAGKRPAEQPIEQEMSTIASGLLLHFG